MELRVLKYFLAIAEEETITKAADILHITQPTLSRQIMQLEDELGTRLFNRSRHGFSLTEDGFFLKKRAEEILSLADGTARDLREKESRELIGEVSIGCTETHSMEMLSEKMKSFHTLHPGVRYSIHTANADTIKEQMEKGLLDIGLLTEPVDTARFSIVRLPVKEQWGALIRSDSALACRQSLSPEDLTGERLLLPLRSEVRFTLEQWFGRSFQELNIPVRYNLGRNVAVLVQSGLGIGIGFDLFSGYEGLQFIPLSPALSAGSVLCWKKSQIFSPAAEGFIGFLENAFEA